MSDNGEYSVLQRGHKQQQQQQQQHVNKQKTTFYMSTLIFIIISDLCPKCVYNNIQSIFTSINE